MNKMKNSSKELSKYKALILVTLDYYLENIEYHINTCEFDSIDHYSKLKSQALENYNKSRLTTLKKWFTDLTEIHVESKNFKFNEYLIEKTAYEIDIHTTFSERVQLTIEKGKSNDHPTAGIFQSFVTTFE
jgi:hypothetical protein